MTSPLLSIRVIITIKNDTPAIMLRGVTTATPIMQAIIMAAINDQAISVAPVFNDKVRALGSLIEKGVIYEDEGSYYFL